MDNDLANQITFDGVKSAVENMLQKGVEFENLLSLVRRRFLDKHNIAIFTVSDLAGNYLVQISGDEPIHRYFYHAVEALEFAFDHVDKQAANGN